MSWTQNYRCNQLVDIKLGAHWHKNRTVCMIDHDCGVVGVVEDMQTWFDHHTCIYITDPVNIRVAASIFMSDELTPVVCPYKPGQKVEFCVGVPGVDSTWCEGTVESVIEDSESTHIIGQVKYLGKWFTIKFLYPLHRDSIRPLARPQSNTRYPHTCPTCGAAAYIGFSDTECSNSHCKGVLK